MRRLALCTMLVLLAAVPAAQGQVLVGYDGVGLELTEFTQTSGGVCPAPNPESFVCNAGVPDSVRRSWNTSYEGKRIGGVA